MWFPCLIFYEESEIVEGEFFTKTTQNLNESNISANNSFSLDNSLNNSISSPERKPHDISMNNIRPRGYSQANTLMFNPNKENLEKREKKINSIFEKKEKGIETRNKRQSFAANDPKRIVLRQRQMDLSKMNNRMVTDESFHVNESCPSFSNITNISETNQTEEDTTDMLNKEEFKANEKNEDISDQDKVDKSECTFFGLCGIY